MSGENKNFDKTDASQATDFAIRRSLLGRADAVEQAKFEALLMLDDGFEKRVHRLELELADDFSFGKLSSEEQKLFTTRFLVTPGRVRELAVSEALRKVMSSESTSHVRLARQGWNLSSLNLLAFDRPFASAVLAGVALLVFGTLSWFSMKAPPVRPPAISRRQPAPNPEKRFAHPVVSPDPKGNSANDQGTAQEQVPTLTLLPEDGSESRQTLQLPNAGVARIRLELLVDVDVDSASSPIYEAKLMPADGLPSTFSDLKAQPGRQAKVVINLPGQNLKSGDYTIELRRMSEAGTSGLQRYSFIVKQD